VIGGALWNIDGLCFSLTGLEDQTLALLLPTEDFDDGCATQQVGHSQHETVFDVLMKIRSNIPLVSSLGHLLFHSRDLISTHFLKLDALVRSQLLLDLLEEFELIKTVYKTLLRKDEVDFVKRNLQLSVVFALKQAYFHGLNNRLVQLQKSVQVPH
jgi:hypothetical protein